MRLFLVILFIFLLGGLVFVGVNLINGPASKLRNLSSLVIQGKVNRSQADETLAIKEKTLSLLDLNSRFRINEDSPILQKPDEAEMLKIAKERQTLIEKQLDSNPRALLEVAIPAELQLQFPLSIQPYLEHSINLEAQIETLHMDNFEKKTSKDEHYLKTAKGRQRIYVAGRPQQFLAGSKVRVRGLEIGNKVVVDTNEPGQLTVTEASTVVPVLGARRIAMILFNFQNDQSKTFTIDEARKSAFTDALSANGRIKDSSFEQASLVGKIRTDGDIFGWFTVPFSNTTDCGVGAWADAAKQKALDSGVDLSGYDHIVYVFNYGPLCNFGGIATIGGDWSALNGGVGPVTMIHELAHNFGALHSSVLVCVDQSGRQVPLSANCKNDEYGDQFDPMGSGQYRQFSNYNKGLFGWLRPQNQMTVKTSGTFTLFPNQTPSDNITTIQIPRDFDSEGNVTKSYFLEKKAWVGIEKSYNSNEAVFNGLSVRLGPPPELRVNTGLIDSTPGTTLSYDAPLLVGRSFQDDEMGLILITKQLEGDSMNFTVNRTPPQCVHYDPVLVVSPFQQWGLAGEAKKYQVSVTSTDSSQCGAELFDVEVSDAPTKGFVISPGKLSFSLVPGQSQTQTVSIKSPLKIKPDWYSMKAKITRSVPGNFVQTYYFVYMLSKYETVPPTTQFVFPSNGVMISGVANVQVKGKDNVGIAKIQLSLDGKVVAKNVGEGVLKFNWNTASVSNGKHVLSAKVFDPSGNKATAKASVTVSN